MRNLTFFAVSALALVTAAPAIAADPYADNMLSEASAYDWSGFYVGVSGGYGWLNDLDRSFTPPFPDSGQDWILGVHGGYLHQVGDLVFGGELEFRRLDITYTTASFITVDYGYVAKARVGYSYDRFLVSAFAGGAYVTTNFMGLKDWGLAAGVGLEYAVTDNITFGLEYGRYAYRNFSGTMIDATLDELVVRASVGF